MNITPFTFYIFTYYYTTTCLIIIKRARDVVILLYSFGKNCFRALNLDIFRIVRKSVLLVLRSSRFAKRSNRDRLI